MIQVKYKGSLDQSGSNRGVRSGQFFISESGFPNGFTVGCGREDLGMAPRVLSWTAGRLRWLSTDLEGVGFGGRSEVPFWT